MGSLSFTAEEKDQGRQLKHVAAARLMMGRRLFSRIKFQNGLLVNGTAVHADYRLLAGDVVTVLLPEDAHHAIPCRDIPIDIVYEDADLLVVNKPAPLPSISSAKKDQSTLENALAARLGLNGNFVYRPVNRLDKGTSGLMVVARHAHAQQRLQKQLHTPEFVREYLAVVEGIPNPPSGLIDMPIAKIEPAGVKRCVSPEGKESRTRYETIAVRGSRSLLRIRLDTGRTHQIRVHMQWLGCPVSGDFLYGTELPDLPGRFALHAYRLHFCHPVTGEILTFTKPLPKELLRFWTDAGN